MIAVVKPLPEAGKCRPEQACAVPASRQCVCRKAAGTAQACSGLRASGIWDAKHTRLPDSKGLGVTTHKTDVQTASGQDLFDNLATDIGEPIVKSLEAKGESFVVQSEQM